MADISSPAPTTRDGNQHPQESTESRLSHWMHGAVHEAQELGKKAINSNAAQRAKELGKEAIHSRAVREIQDSGQHIIHGVVQRGKDAATAGTDVVHDAQQDKADPKHLLNAGEKVGVATLAASPHALVAEVVGSAVKDEVVRKASVSQRTKERIDHITNPKRTVTDKAHQQLNEAVKNLPVLELHGLFGGSHQPKTSAKELPDQPSEHD